MSKTALVEAIAADAGLTKADAARAVDAFVAAVTKSLAKGDNVTLVGFGTFKASKRAARKGINPQTGAAVDIPARVAATFKAGSKLKDALN